ncbi:MAG: phosphatidylglycerophosphatase A [Synergistaceae bacterium]|jgi:phosphatidylglycerophosphatase A|nr:phosphatidylglycerophosphatase A [Synergistaceae bacterium]
MKPGMKKNVLTWYGLIATVGGVGTFSKMPGTLGSAVGLAIFFIMGRVDLYLLAAVVALGTVAADKYARETGGEDPGEVVIDEVAGFWVSVLGFDMSFAIVGFFLFRIVDILKPFPVRNMERLPGGIGIMADDLCGGLVVNILLRFLWWLFFSGGFDIIYGFFGMGA